jgi:hypothetical protein
MTKKEIVRNIHQADAYLRPGSRTTLNDWIKIYDQAMDDFAQQQSIAYNEWVQSFENSMQAKRFFGVKTDDELYAIFLEHQSKQP